MKKRSVLAATLLTVGLASTSHAFFVSEIAKQPEPPSFDLAGVGSIVTQVGVPLKDKAPVSFGTSIPLETAIAMILPPKWSYINGQKVNGAVPVSWPRSDNWLASLESVGRAGNVRFLVNWEEKRVYAATAAETMKVQSAEGLVKAKPVPRPVKPASFVENVSVEANQDR